MIIEALGLLYSMNKGGSLRPKGFIIECEALLHI